MPVRAPRICSCGKTVASGVVCACRAQRKAEFDARRPSAAARGYDAAWKRVRSMFLKAHPACCAPGCDRPATEADHIVSVADRPDLRLSWSNLRPFCKPHHSQRTARDQAFGRAKGGVGRNFDEGDRDRLGYSARDIAQLENNSGGDR